MTPLFALPPSFYIHLYTQFSLQLLRFRHFSPRLFTRLLLPLDIYWRMLCCMIVLSMTSLPRERQAKSLCCFERTWHKSHTWLKGPLKEHPGSGAALRSYAISQGLGFRGRELQGSVKGLNQLPYHCPLRAQGLLLSPSWVSAQRVQEGLLTCPDQGSKDVPWVWPYHPSLAVEEFSATGRGAPGEILPYTSRLLPLGQQ